MWRWQEHWIAFTFAANAMVRFRGTHDRISLILAFGFVLAGLIEAGTSMTFYRGMLVAASSGGEHISLGWLAGRTLLGVLLVAGLVVEDRIPVSRDPGKEIAGSTLIVGVAAYLTSVFYFMLPNAPRINPGATALARGTYPGGDLRCGDSRIWIASTPRECVSRPGAVHCRSPECNRPRHDEPV